jgi:hypothetical protein
MACVVETGMAAQVAASMKKAPAASAQAMPAQHAILLSLFANVFIRPAGVNQL